ncbi:hypothetical protein E6H27_02930 [Candidatus Bathyarchaeota archaeon]|nr:MAG: hypothetical protein E6H27_02930 [Candidatus Bathyarchaeota archaeon]
MNPVRKYLKSKKGINTILASLLMVVIVVVASVMVYAWSTGLLGTLLVQPNVGKEALTMDTFAFPSNNNVTLTLRNAGTVAVTFSSYYVKNATGTTYTQSGWTWGPTIQPNAPGLANIGITAGCVGCGSFSTSSFTFVSGNSYTVTLVTSRNNQFNFNVIR